MKKASIWAETLNSSDMLSQIPEAEPGDLILLLFPFVLIVLLQEVAIGDLPHFSALANRPRQFLLMTEYRAAAERIREGDRAAIQAQVVDAVIVDIPGIDEAVVAPGPVEQSRRS